MTDIKNLLSFKTFYEILLILFLKAKTFFYNQCKVRVLLSPKTLIISTGFSKYVRPFKVSRTRYWKIVKMEDIVFRKQYSDCFKSCFQLTTK